SRHCIFTATAPSEISTLSLHDALPISTCLRVLKLTTNYATRICLRRRAPRHTRKSCLLPFRAHNQWEDRRPDHEETADCARWQRSEEHTSELQSLAYLVCRLLLEKKKR